VDVTKGTAPRGFVPTDSFKISHGIERDDDALFILREIGSHAKLERNGSPMHAKLESANSGSPPDTREAPRRGGWGGGCMLAMMAG
jgi:hypothetical protein